MSQIFDALQRSEAERSGASAAEPLQATQVLRNAERLAVSKWKDTTRHGRQEPTEFADRVLPIDQKILHEGPSKASIPTKDDPIPAEGRLNVLSQFKPIAYTLAPNSRHVSFTEKDSAVAEAFRLLG